MKTAGPVGLTVVLHLSPELYAFKMVSKSTDNRFSFPSDRSFMV